MPSVVLQGVGRRFAGVTAVDAVDLAIEHGEFVTLLGPSGCGKTTTLRMVAGLEHNDTGSIAIAGRIVSDAGSRLFVPPDKRQLGMVFQSYAIWPHMTVFDNVGYPLSVRGVAKPEIVRRVAEALRLVEMEAYADRPAPALSGGQQQRVAIARALVFEPEVLLLDEPLSNLDARLRSQMGGEFRALQRRLGITTLYVTHDQEEAMALSDRVVVMHKGRVLQAGRPEDVYRRPASREVAIFFGAPNLVGATVASCRQNGDGYLLEIEGAHGRGACRAGEPFQPGDPVVLIARPEDMVLAGADRVARDGELRWCGTVADASFRGARRVITVDSTGLSIRAECPASRGATIGNDATLVLDPRDAWAVRAQ
jgi:iron(III) transport system ATP-binding protein